MHERESAFDNPLRPLRHTTVGEALDLGFELLRSRLGLLVGLTLTFFLPVRILDLLVRFSLPDLAATDSDRVASALGVAGLGAGSGWLLIPPLFQMVSQSLLGISCGFLAVEMVSGAAPGYRKVVSFALKRLPSACTIVVVVGVIIGLGAVLATVGMLIFASWLFIASVVAGAEGLGPLAAVKRSMSLSRTSAGPAMIMFLGGTLITSVVRGVLLAGPLVILQFLGVPDFASVLVEQFSMLLLLAAPPLTACLATTAYLSMRTRSEGLDLRLRMVDR